MTQVFISYARADRSRVRYIADALEDEGISVWWDSHLMPGQVFTEEIEERLRDAMAVIVVWSTASRASKWVRDEAQLADERQVVVPVLIEDTRPPLPFGVLHTERLIGWNGDRSADAWQRVMLQVRALVGETSDAPSGSSSVQANAARTHNEPAAPRHSLRSPYLWQPGLALALVAATTLVLAGPSQLGTLGTLLVSAVMVLAVFRGADADMNPGAKALVARWFLPVSGKATVSVTDAFYGLFTALFDYRHFTLKCFGRSVLVTFLVFTATVLTVGFASDGFIVDRAELFAEISASQNLPGLAARVVIFLLVNFAGDYISLFETRIVLLYTRQRPHLLAVFVVLDALFKLAAFVALIYPAFVLVFLTRVATGVFQWSDFMPYMEAAPSVFVGFLTGESTSKLDSVMAIASAVSAYTSSIWLWMTLALAPIARVALWSRASGLSAIGRLLDAQKKPFTALGYVLALLILVAGVLVWGGARLVGL